MFISEVFSQRELNIRHLEYTSYNCYLVLEWVSQLIACFNIPLKVSLTHCKAQETGAESTPAFNGGAPGPSCDCQFLVPSKSLRSPVSPPTKRGHTPPTFQGWYGSLESNQFWKKKRQIWTLPKLWLEAPGTQHHDPDQGPTTAQGHPATNSLLTYNTILG